MRKFVFISVSISFFVCTIGFMSCRNSSGSPNFSLIDSLLCAADDSVIANPRFSGNLIHRAQTLTTEPAGQCEILRHLIACFVKTNQLDSARFYLSDFLKNIGHLPLADSDERSRQMMYYYNYKGILLSYTTKIDSAILSFNSAYSLALQRKSKEKLSDICINLADMYLRVGDYVNGIRYYREALKPTNGAMPDNSSKFAIYTGLGQAYYAGLMNFRMAGYYFSEADKMIVGRNPGEKFNFYNNRGNYFYYKKDYQNSLVCFRKAEEIARSIQAEFNLHLCYANMSDVYLHLGQTDSARIFYDKSNAYFLQCQQQGLLFYLSIVRAGIAVKEGDYPLAEALFRKYPDSVYPDPQILLIRYQAMQDFYTKTGNYKKAFYYQSQRIAVNDSVRSMAVQNAIVETDMRYKQNTALIRKDYELKSKDNTIHQLTAGVIAVVVLVAFAFVAVLFIFISRKRRFELQRIRQVESLTRIRLQNIRNRISPHFIFNVLNRNMISNLGNEAQQELMTLVKMLRRSLEMTDATSVVLEDELNFVRDYIQLEKAGLGDGFRAELLIAENIDVSRVRILPMMIQIPVENAVKHALKPKEGSKLLIVKVDADKIRRGTVITITDNGSGYDPRISANTKGTGTGLKVIHQTIHILNHRNKEKITFDIRNVDPLSGGGTEISIYIPDHYDFGI